MDLDEIAALLRVLGDAEKYGGQFRWIERAARQRLLEINNELSITKAKSEAAPVEEGSKA